jgi:hypothetical protein
MTRKKIKTKKKQKIIKQYFKKKKKGGGETFSLTILWCAKAVFENLLFFKKNHFSIHFYFYLNFFFKYVGGFIFFQYILKTCYFI